MLSDARILFHPDKSGSVVASTLCLIDDPVSDIVLYFWRAGKYPQIIRASTAYQSILIVIIQHQHPVIRIKEKEE